MPLQQAQYFCTGTLEEVADWRHFALAVPVYTHFTSPIRRYPDVVVHRLLTQLLKDDPEAADRMYNPAPFASIAKNAVDSEFSSVQKRQWQSVQGLTWTLRRPRCC